MFKVKLNNNIFTQERDLICSGQVGQGTSKAAKKGRTWTVGFRCLADRNKITVPNTSEKMTAEIWPWF